MNASQFERDLQAARAETMDASAVLSVSALQKIHEARQRAERAHRGLWVSAGLLVLLVAATGYATLQRGSRIPARTAVEPALVQARPQEAPPEASSAWQLGPHTSVTLKPGTRVAFHEGVLSLESGEMQIRQSTEPLTLSVLDGGTPMRIVARPGAFTLKRVAGKFEISVQRGQVTQTQNGRSTALMPTPAPRPGVARPPAPMNPTVAPVPDAESLWKKARLLRAQSEPRAALEVLRQLERTASGPWPALSLAEQVRIEASVRHRPAEVRALGQRFLSTYPRHRLGVEVRRLWCEAHELQPAACRAKL